MSTGFGSSDQMTTNEDRLWVGEDKETSQLWLYDENHQQTFGCDLVKEVRLFTPTSGIFAHGNLIAVNRAEHRAKVRTVKDSDRRAEAISAYVRWLRIQGFDGIEGSASSASHSNILDMQWAGGAQPDRLYNDPLLYSDS